jgi:hypothetical protein
MIELLHLRFSLVPEQPLRLPAHNKGNSLRGGFGSAFRKLVCVDLRWECAACTLRYNCPYTKVFNPFVPPDAPQLSRNRNIPRPFVVKPPLSRQTEYGTGEVLAFDLVLVGGAMDYLPYFIVAFRELGATGFGLNRAAVQLQRVESIGREGIATAVYDAHTNVVTPAPPLALPAALKASLGGPEEAPRGPTTELTIEFLTPTTLKAGSTPTSDGIIVHRPAFHHIAKRLRDRLNALATFYGSGPLGFDFRRLGEAAERIETVADHTRWLERARYARRRAVSHDLSGFVGRLTVRGELAPFLPLLHLGEYVHVGKNAVFGNGWFRIEGDTAHCVTTTEATAY